MEINSIWEFIVEYEKYWEIIFQNVWDKLKQDRLSVMTILNIDWRFIEFVSDELRDDIYLWIIAIEKSYGHAYLYLSDNLKNNSIVIDNTYIHLGMSIECLEKGIVDIDSEYFKNILNIDKNIIDLLINTESESQFSGNIDIIEDNFEKSNKYLYSILDWKPLSSLEELEELKRCIWIININLKNMCILSRMEIDIIFNTYFKFKDDMKLLLENMKLNAWSYIDIFTNMTHFIDYYKKNIREFKIQKIKKNEDRENKNDMVEKLEVLRDILAVHKNNTEIQLTLIDWMIKDKNYQEALNAINEIIKSNNISGFTIIEPKILDKKKEEILKKSWIKER